MAKSPDPSKPGPFRKFEVVINALGVLLVAGTIYFGLRSQSEAINNQWGQEFYKQKMQVYLQAAEVTSQIAYLKAQDTLQAALDEKIMAFNTLYFGPMAIMEESSVEAAMVMYKRALDEDLPADVLEQLALYLSHVLRNDSRAMYLQETQPSSPYGTNEELLEAMRSYFE
ncbi:MAG: hypothetical protein AAGB22_01600 [Bacteroidota bacterium]